MDRKAASQCGTAQQEGCVKRRSQQMLDGGLPIRKCVVIARMGECRDRREGEKRSNKYAFHSAILLW